MILISAGRVPGICLTTEGKTRKNLSWGFTTHKKTIPIIKIRNKRHLRDHNPKEPTITNHNKKILQSIPLSAKHTLLITVIRNHKEYTPHCSQIHKHNHTIKTTARYVGCCVSRWNVEGKTFIITIHSWSVA